jgi:hypothetical protein
MCGICWIVFVFPKFDFRCLTQNMVTIK